MPADLFRLVLSYPMAQPHKVANTIRNIQFKYYSSEFEDHENKIESLINKLISDNLDINKLYYKNH